MLPGSSQQIWFAEAQGFEQPRPETISLSSCDTLPSLVPAGLVHATASVATPANASAASERTMEMEAKEEVFMNGSSMVERACAPRAAEASVVHSPLMWPKRRTLVIENRKKDPLVRGFARRHSRAALHRPASPTLHVVGAHFGPGAHARLHSPKLSADSQQISLVAAHVLGPQSAWPPSWPASTKQS